MPETTVEIFSDGACSGNPGPGGYGAISIPPITVWSLPELSRR